MLRTWFEQAILDAGQSDRFGGGFELGMKLGKRALTAGRSSLLQNIAERQQAALIFHRCTLPRFAEPFLAGTANSLPTCLVASNLAIVARAGLPCPVVPGAVGA
jgi:hypothetical protein